MKTFKTSPLWMLLAACLNISNLSLSAALSTEISYQGRLTASGIPVQGEFDLSVQLYDMANGGNTVGLPNTNFNVLVSNGFFTTTLDFGEDVFNGNTYWLEAAVRPSGTALPFSPLLPRQPLTAAPYALYAPNAATAADFTNSLAGDVTGTQDNTTVGFIQGVSVSPQTPQHNQFLLFDEERWVPSHLVLNSNVVGVLEDSNLSGNIPRLDQNQTFTGQNTFDGPGIPFAVGHDTRIPNLNADLVDGLEATDLWQLGGNGGTDANLNFIGTTDNESLTFRVNNVQALRLEPNSLSPIVIGGWNGNQVASSAAGATISGGGSSDFVNSISTSATFASIGGGRANTIGASSYDSVIAGGVESTVQSEAFRSTISGGAHNIIETGANLATIGGGTDNRIAGGAGTSTIGGGSGNVIDTGAFRSVIAGGTDNTIGPTADFSSIHGGVDNVIESGSFRSTIAGGTLNRIGTNADHAIIAGSAHVIDNGSYRSVIIGGTDNAIEANAQYSSILGGVNNIIEQDAFRSVIAGATESRIRANADNSIIAGGSSQEIEASSFRSIIAGGTGNRIGASASFSSIVGGNDHIIESGAFRSTIAGGGPNRIGTNAIYSTISGGGNNEVESDASYATIPGGLDAKASHYGQLSYAGGSFENAGDAQISTYVLRGETSASRPTDEVFLDGNNARMTVRTNATWMFDMLVVGRSTNYLSSGFKFTGVVRNASPGPIALVGPVDKSSFGLPDWDADVAVEVSDHTLRIEVTGGTNSPPTIRWVANVRTAEITY